MYNSDTEMLFPTRVIPSLGSLHGDEWRRLVDHLHSAEALPAERHAFVLMLLRQCGCVGCNADSFRAMRGCTLCARQTVKRLRGSDQEIIEQYKQALKEVESFMAKSKVVSEKK